MLVEYLQLIGYVVFVQFHNILFFAMIVSLLRIFFVKQNAYDAMFVGGYLFAHSIYGGCPLLEIQNYLASQVNGNISQIGEVYTMFGDLGYVVRIVMIISSSILLYYSFRFTHTLDTRININRLLSPQKVQEVI